MMGSQRLERYLRSFDEEAPASIRLNPLKAAALTPTDAERVPWCRDGYYLRQRPNFTMDPLLHAGCYYVQEAASMFLDEVLRQLHNAYVSRQPYAIRPQTALDLCAAPGGKSTLLRAALPADCLLYSNEPMRNRVNILQENVQKWGWSCHVVTNSYPQAYRESGLQFDLIVCDVPCSGEGMFRKNPATIGEWSPQQVEKCAALQRDIVSNAWHCLQPGGIFIYSTCTFNTKENEENVRWLLTEYDAEVIAIDTKPEWNITGSLLDGFTAPVYRFIPGITRSEGLFMCVLRKKGSASPHHPSRGASTLHTLQSTPLTDASAPRCDLSYPEAIAYLRGETLALPPDTPRGHVVVTFMDHPLGMVKNIGSRANNLYPKPWRIKTTHIPHDYEAILRHT